MILIISTCTNKFHEEEFVKPIEQIVKKENMKYEIKHYSQIKKIEKYFYIIICGTALKDNEYLKGKFSWIKDFKKSLLGICAGAQIIAKEFGEEVKTGEEIGLFKPTKIKENLILNGVSLKEIYCLHKKYTNVPKGFDLLLKTKYPQLFKKDKIICSLFHPEVRCENIIKKFLYLN